MPVTTYATVAMFFDWGLPQTALGARTVADVQSALDAASVCMDDFFRGRFPLPFSRVGLSVSMKCVAIAVNIFLGGRGMSPVTGSDQSVIAGLADAKDWLDRVQRRVLFPEVVSDPNALMPTSLTEPGSPQPLALSQPPRGWYCPIG